MPDWVSNLLDSPIVKLLSLIADTLTLRGTQLWTCIPRGLRRLRDRRSESQVQNWCDMLNSDRESIRLEAKLKLVDCGDKAVPSPRRVLSTGTCRGRKLAVEALCDIGAPALKCMLAARGEDHIVGYIDDALQDYLPRVAHRAQVVDELKALLDDDDDLIQVGAAQALGKYPSPDIIRALGRKLYPTECKNDEVRKVAAQSLGETKDPAAMAYLVIALKDHSRGVRQAACEALSDIRIQRSNAVLGQKLRKAIDALSSVLLPDPDLEPRIEAALTLGRSANRTAETILGRALQDLPDDDFHRRLREAVGTALSEMHPREATGG